MSIVAVPKTSRKPQPSQYSNVPAPANTTITTATRSCASPRKALAERVGFEPTRLSPTAFRERRSEEHTSESSHSQISYAVFCLKKKNLILCLVNILPISVFDP